MLDLAAKVWARSGLDPYAPPSDFLPFVSLRLTFNTGISFSFLSFDHDIGRLALLAVTGVLTIFLIVWVYRTQRGRERLALSMIIAGALANFLDRAINGTITDYLDLHFGDWNLFVFNLADVWISIGVVYFVFLQIFTNKERPSTI